MATPAQLVAVIAKTLGVPETTVSTHDRNLAMAGYRTIGGRGKGAARMTAKDAAHLLLSVAGTTVAKDSVRPIERHGRMRSSDGAWILEPLPLTGLQALKPNHSFLEALEAILEATIDGSLERQIFEYSGEEWPDEWMLPIEIIVNIQEPRTWSSIEIRTVEPDRDEGPTPLSSELKRYASHVKSGTGNLSYDPPIIEFGRADNDLSHTHTFTLRTFIAIANLLRS